MWLYTVARWACLPFSVLGGWVCWRWANNLYGARAGLASLVLWCSHPLILGHGSLITADVPAAACGALAGYCFWRWMRDPCGPRAVALGVSLGLTLLVKTTWLLLLVLWPVKWAFSRWVQARRGEAVAWWSEAVQLPAAVAIGVLIVHLGYGLEQPLTPLGEFRCISRELGGDAPREQRFTRGANRFAGTWVGRIPVPLPANYVLGIDVQRRDFEVGERSYLVGEWTDHGRWWFYLFGLAVKTPEPALLILLLAFVTALTRRSRVSMKDELLLLSPAVAVLVLVSSQTGMNSHLRYAIPALPFLFIWSSRLLGDLARNSPPRAFCPLEVVALLGAGDVNFIEVESSCNSSQCRSRNAFSNGSQTPLVHHRRNRRHTLFHRPNRSGKSRHVAPVRAIHMTA
jgi:hypothetical protein